MTGDEETVTVTAEAGNEKTSRQVTLKKAEIQKFLSMISMLPMEKKHS